MSSGGKIVAPRFETFATISALSGTSASSNECLLSGAKRTSRRLVATSPNNSMRAYTNSRCSRPMCGIAARLLRPSKYLIRLAIMMRPSPHNGGGMSQDFRVWVLAAVSDWLLKVHAPFWSKSFCYFRRAVDFARISHALHQRLFAPAWV